MKENSVTTTSCKYCGSNGIIKFGKYRDIQYYFCKSCRRKFRANNSVFHMKMPAEYLVTAISRYYEGFDIAEIRSQFKQAYDYCPSRSVVYRWINKYTGIAVKHLAHNRPVVGSTWIIIETMVEIKERKVLIYDLIDRKTRYLLASWTCRHSTFDETKTVINNVIKKVGKMPEMFIVVVPYPNTDAVKNAIGGSFEVRIHKQHRYIDHGEFIERFNIALKDGTKSLRSFRFISILDRFIEGWAIYYNYFKRCPQLNNKTPAEKCYIDYDIKSWSDLVCRGEVTSAARKTTKTVHSA